MSCLKKSTVDPEVVTDDLCYCACAPKQASRVHIMSCLYYYGGGAYLTGPMVYMKTYMFNIFY